MERMARCRVTSETQPPRVLGRSTHSGLQTDSVTFLSELFLGSSHLPDVFVKINFTNTLKYLSLKYFIPANATVWF